MLSALWPLTCEQACCRKPRLHRRSTTSWRLVYNTMHLHPGILHSTLLQPSEQVLTVWHVASASPAATTTHCLLRHCRVTGGLSTWWGHGRAWSWGGISPRCHCSDGQHHCLWTPQNTMWSWLDNYEIILFNIDGDILNKLVIFIDIVLLTLIRRRSNNHLRPYFSPLTTSPTIQCFIVSGINSNILFCDNWIFSQHSCPYWKHRFNSNETL